MLSSFNPQHVSATAVLTAHMRALETVRKNGLISDPYAAPLVAASGIDLSEVNLSAVTGQRVFESNVVRTRWIDDQVLGAFDRGCSQLVILGSGLDTRVLRLNLPSHATVYEIDFAQVLEFKKDVWRREGLKFHADWRPIGLGLTDPSLMNELVANGFDTNIPTAWVAEGVLFYLSERQSDSLVSMAARNSPYGSEFMAVHFGPGSREEAQSREMNDAASAAGFGFQSYILDPGEWLSGLGWNGIEVTTIGRAGITHGRPISYDGPETAGNEITWLVHAYRK